MWCVVVLCGVVCFGMVWCCVLWCDAVWCAERNRTDEDAPDTLLQDPENLLYLGAPVSLPAACHYLRNQLAFLITYFVSHFSLLKFLCELRKTARPLLCLSEVKYVSVFLSVCRRRWTWTRSAS